MATKKNEKLIVSAEILGSMRDKKQFRIAGYRLHKGFAGQYKSTGVVPTEYGTDKDQSFRLSCTSDSGNHSISGFHMVNAYVVPKKVEMPDKGVKEGIGNIYYFDQLQDVLMQSQRLHVLTKTDTDFTLPVKFEILGAAVGKDAEGDHPYIPLSRYPFYKVLLAHHQKSSPDSTYIDRDTINYLLGLEGEERPAIPEGYEFKLINHDEAIWRMANWSPTLIIRQW